MDVLYLYWLDYNLLMNHFAKLRDVTELPFQHGQKDGYSRWAPKPVISRITTPISRVISPQLPIDFRPFIGVKL